jgi:hypothetical protein
MNATINNIQQYQEIQNFTQFIISNAQFVQEHSSIVILNGIDKSLARSKGMSSTPFAGQLAVKLKRYGFNVTSTENAATSSSGSYLIVHTVDPREASIAAIQTFLPLTDIRYDTGSLLTGIDEHGNVHSYLN